MHLSVFLHFSTPVFYILTNASKEFPGEDNKVVLRCIVLFCVPVALTYFIN